jgi:hypothetical protein
MTADDREVPSVRIPSPLPDGVSQETIGVRGGLLRSGFDETSEGLYLTSGYVYDSAGEAEKAFTGEVDRQGLASLAHQAQHQGDHQGLFVGLARGGRSVLAHR